MGNRNFRSDENRDFGGRDIERHRRSGGGEGVRSLQGQYRNEDDNWWGRRSSFEGGPDADDEFEESTQGRSAGRYGQPSHDWRQHAREDFDGGRGQVGQYGDSPEFSRRSGQTGYGSGNRGQFTQGNTAAYGYGGDYGQRGSRYNPAAGQMGAGSSGYGNFAGSGNVGYRSGTAGSYSRRGPKNYQRSDERLKEDICDRLLHDVDVDASEVTVEVKAGKVTLDGSVPERYMKHCIEDIADGCYGVKEVDNKVRVSAQSGSTIAGESQNSTSNTDAAAGRLK